ncbi:telomerase reverse transcriptase-like [Ostrinia furnacalis]|uniref:telomerase reverse transcriptase-like n=1 Tax=Ostrinia furnacalis TaxID=93504 RepID=UPI00103EDDDD|nr:telomerase reverse transcriptase-like [Ostrinia furnacalis]
MDVPICFTQHFVDKQNVRSYGNIIKKSLLKEENETQFLRNIFEDETLVSGLRPNLLQHLRNLRENVQKYSKQDFRNYFPENGFTGDSKESKELNSLNKSEIFSKCWLALYDIIPKELYGNGHNENVFKKFVQIIVHGMKRQHIILSKILLKWDFSPYVWHQLDRIVAQKILYHILSWIIRNILSPMICLNFYITTCKLDADENKLHFFWKNQWQSFYDKTIYKMICRSVIKISPPYCMGRKYKQHHSHSNKMKLKMLMKEIPKLHLVLKANHDCRPIVRYKNDSLTPADKNRIKERLNFLRKLTGRSHKKTESQFSVLYSNWLKLNRPKLYFIRTDLSNAFGCVNKEKLITILHERFRKLKEEAGVSEKMLHQFKDMISELRRPLLIRTGSTVYEWKKGLVQGYKYSPALSELYYNHLDEQYFENFIKTTENNIKLFVRVVDDYLYVTDSLEDAEMFLKALSNYDNVNYEKTVVNFSHPTIKYSEEITFLGYCYNTVTLHVSRAQNVLTGQMCYKITFNSSIDNIYKFLETRIGQSSQISGHIFNFIHNSEEIVWGHIFSTFCLSANKFCTILAMLCDECEMRDLLKLYKRKVTVRLTNTILEVLMKNKPKDYTFMYCINHFRYISWLALNLCAKLTPKCLKLVPFIKDELAKSNCLFGKWRDHASRIDIDGNNLRQAVKVVCRRTDLRAIVKKFDTLPEGFQCYHHKLLLKCN